MEPMMLKIAYLWNISAELQGIWNSFAFSAKRPTRLLSWRRPHRSSIKHAPRTVALSNNFLSSLSSSAAWSSVLGCCSMLSGILRSTPNTALSSSSILSQYTFQTFTALLFFSVSVCVVSCFDCYARSQGDHSKYRHCALGRRILQPLT